MPTAVGLEITANAVKAAVVEGGPKRFRIRDFVIGRMASPTDEVGDIPVGDVDVISVLREVLRRHKLPRSPIVCSIRAQDCVIREISVPFTREDQIQKTIRFQAENYFHAVSIDDLIIDYYKFDELEGKSRLLVAGVKRNHIERKLSLLSECNLDPMALDLDVAATFNAYSAIGLFEEHGVVLVVDIEADTVKLILVENGRLRAARSVRMRLGTIAGKASGRRRMISERVGSQSDDESTLDESDQGLDVRNDSSRLPVVILDEGNDPGFRLEDSQITDVERENYLQKIFLEIDRTLAATHAADQIDLIALTGASCALEGIEVMFEEHFEISTRRIALSEEIPAAKTRIDAEALDYQGAIPVGLAMKALGHDAAGMDFRREEYSFQGRFDRVRKGVAACLCLVFLLLFVIAYGFKIELKRIGRKRERVRNEQMFVLQTLFPETAAGLQPEDDLYGAFNAEARRLQEKYGQGRNMRFVFKASALDILAEYCRGQAPFKNRVKIRTINIQQDRSTVDGWADSNEVPSQLQIEINRVSPLIQAELRQTTKSNKGEGWNFQLELRVREEPEG